MLNSLGLVLPQAAEKFGDETALVFEGREFSFVELNELSDRMANGLAGLGIGVGDRVTLYAPNSWEWIVSYYAALKIGAVINPINVMLTPEEVEFVVQDCGAKAIIASKDKGTPVLGVEAKSDVKEIILFGEDLPDGATSFNELIANNEPGFEVVIRPMDELSTICYTSGTTGHPKGAMLTGGSVILNTAMTAQMHQRNSDDIVVSALPCAHVYGNVIMNGAFFYGMTLVLHPKFDAAECMESIQKHKATMFEGVPTMYMYMINHADVAKYDFSSLTRCTVGGQTMPIPKMEEVEARFGCPLIELWGMTEIAGLGTTFPLYATIKHGSIGIALPYTEVRIADVEDGSKTLPTGEVGELMIRGTIVMLGYYGNEQATKETIEPDGWLHTGDVASMDEDGCVFIVDRKKDMILTAGFNVYPAELERVIAGHASVGMVAVGTIPDETKGELAKAYIVLKEGETGDADAIIAYCREHLAAYKVPRAVQFVEDLPKTSTGKVMRRKLCELDE